MQLAAIPQDELSNLLEESLSRPPSAVGKRLRTEEELAVALQLSRWRLRESLNQLVQRGYLARRRGSGTYIRKVPLPLQDYAQRPKAERIDPRVLLAEADDASERPMRFQQTEAQRRLSLGLWSDLYRNDTFAQRMLASLVDYSHDLGHRLIVQGASREFATGSAEERRRLLQEHPTDGYLVMAEWAQQFIEALGGQQVPAVFFWLGSTHVRHEPLITLDTEEAAARATVLLAEQGYERIAMVGYVPGGHIDKLPLNSMGYEQGMRVAGLEYRGAALCDQSEGAIGAMRAARQLLQAQQPPDAFYVSDDHALPGVVEALKDANRTLGKDFGLITLANRGIDLPQGAAWSSVEFDAAALAQSAVDALLRTVEAAGAYSPSLAVRARWSPGATHLRRPLAAAGNTDGKEA